jgi:hypothetical protein
MFVRVSYIIMIMSIIDIFRGPSVWTIFTLSTSALTISEGRGVVAKNSIIEVIPSFLQGFGAFCCTPWRELYPLQVSSG